MRAAGWRLRELAGPAFHAAIIAGAGLIAPMASAVLGLVLVNRLEAAALGTWGLATSLTQFLPLFSLGAPMWLYVHSGSRHLEGDPDRDDRVLGVVLLTLPAVVITFALIGNLSGLSLSGSAQFGIGCALSQISAYQVVRLRAAGRLVAANGSAGIDRLVMAGAFLLIAAYGSTSPDAIAASWLLGQIVVAGITLGIMFPPRPRKPSSITQFSSGLYVSVALACINSALSVARLPIVHFGSEAVGLFVAAGYLTLPVLAVGAAVDQLAFFRLTGSRIAVEDRPLTWMRFTHLTLLGVAASALAVRAAGPMALAALNRDYASVVDIAGPVLAWSVSMSMIGLSMKRLLSDARLPETARSAAAGCMIMLVGISVPILLGAGLRPSLQFFSASSLLASYWTMQQAHSHHAPLGHTALGGWILVVGVLTAS
jgi:hypothetical protein